MKVYLKEDWIKNPTWEDLLYKFGEEKPSFSGLVSPEGNLFISPEGADLPVPKEVADRSVMHFSIHAPGSGAHERSDLHGGKYSIRIREEWGEELVNNENFKQAFGDEFELSTYVVDWE